MIGRRLLVTEQLDGINNHLCFEGGLLTNFLQLSSCFDDLNASSEISNRLC